jgi:hypothetical protein
MRNDCLVVVWRLDLVAHLISRLALIVSNTLDQYAHG